ncbi:Cytochrome c [Rubripirellula amarantea]|uniref:Cytochrome c n=1 Tax=Rubripirellula amarantea TaxID=2527999 RepID=A0A5C5WQB2_9BACT|nr:PVC-type heme-binding CxxCH protein [Rubripirellula amarantea]TWT52727.1 Cytochrome c [Rubripirellula amarantea]
MLEAVVAVRARLSATIVAFLVLFPPFAVAETPSANEIKIEPNQRIALVGNSTAERMNLFGHFETRLQLRLADKQPVIRNFGWPADAVSIQQRPGNYTQIDDPYLVFRPDMLVCFFGFNESFDGRDEATLAKFASDYRKYIDSETKRLAVDGRNPRFVLVSPVAFESSGNPVQPDGVEENKNLEAYAAVVKEVAQTDGHGFVDLFHPTSQAFAETPGTQFTINGIHLNEDGDSLVAEILERELFGPAVTSTNADTFERIRKIVNEKSWLHLQDYRMLNGWYVYGGRRTWDTETFPGEFQKIRKMVDVRDRYLWDLATGNPVPDEPDDSGTGEVFIPETMFGSRDDSFREMREPKTLEYPTPEASISQMTIPEGFEVKLFASEREFPELANPTQTEFDSRGRLWVSCMVNYPQWLPGKVKPDDRLLIFEDTDNDGKADVCKTFYDKLICPTGFEFYKDGVLVIDEPRILFLRDTDGDDVADEVTHLLDGIGTDDTHHAMGAWEYSPGGRLHMLEGIAMSTTLETPWGPKRQNGASGAYVWDLESQRISHFRTPGQYNPWCLVFDKDGNGIIGDGTNAQQHWTNILSSGEVDTRSSVDAIFNNEGIRPAAGNEILRTRQFPDDYHNQLIYACVINLHGMPAFEIGDDADTCGLTGKRVDNFLESTDMFFRPVDPKIGPDGALWFGDWCNALIGHMQYSQRDPNRDHQHGRIYRMFYKDKPLLPVVTQAYRSIEEVIEQLTAFETRTRYRARRELLGRDRDEVLAAIDAWTKSSQDPDALREALWVQEMMHAVDRDLVERLLAEKDFRYRAAAIHVIGNEWRYLQNPNELLWKGAQDEHPRVRLETVRAASLQPTEEAVQIAVSVAAESRDKWIDYVLEHALQALGPIWEKADDERLMASLSPAAKTFLNDYKIARGPGADVHKPLKVLVNVDAKANDKQKALLEVVAAAKGDRDVGKTVFTRVCAACHQHGELGKKFGPQLSGLGDRMSKEEIIRSIVWPNESIAKGYETIMVLDFDGVATNGFILSEDDDQITLGIADGKQKTILKDDIEIRKDMNASSMPEGLTETIAPKEFLDLLAFLMGDWIATNPNLDYNLQSNNGLKEVSRQTHVKLGPGFPAGLNEEATHLLSHEGVRNYSFAVHSPNKPTDQNFVVIRFNEPTKVGHVKIFNRRDAVFHDRAKGIAMWTSNDGVEWTQVWHSDEAYPDWSFGLSMDQPIKYAKIGLTKPGIFHIDRVTFYGEIVPEQE